MSPIVWILLILVALAAGGAGGFVYRKNVAEQKIGRTEAYAKQLLEQKKLLNLSIGDIAGMCGYYDERYFSRVFRAKTGMSPREYLLQSGLSDDGPEDA